MSSSKVEPSWGDALDGLDLPGGDSVPTEKSSQAASSDLAPPPAAHREPDGRPGHTQDGKRSALVRTRAGDLVWFLAAPASKFLAVLTILALVSAVALLYAKPRVEAWWQEQTNPPEPDPQIIYVTSEPTDEPDEPEDEAEEEPEPEQSPTPTPTQPRTPSARATTSTTVSCTGDATVTFTARGSGTLQMNGATSGSGTGSVTRSVELSGGSATVHASAEEAVHLEHVWSGTGSCN